MVKLTINEIDYYTHPIYDANAGSADGNVINICEKKLLKGNKSYSGYSYVSVSKYSIFGPSESRGYLIHRFVWECFNDAIEEGQEIIHINDNKEDNRLCNLQLIKLKKRVGMMFTCPNCNKFYKKSEEYTHKYCRKHESVEDWTDDELEGGWMYDRHTKKIKKKKVTQCDHVFIPQYLT